METYNKILDVFRQVGKAMTPPEFREETVNNADSETGFSSGLRYVGCTESTLARRMRELAQQGRLIRRKREGKQYVEFALPVAVAVVR